MRKQVRESHTYHEHDDVPYQVPLACPDSPSSSDNEVDWVSSATMSDLRLLFAKGCAQTTYAEQLAVNDCIGAFIANVTPGHELCDHGPNKYIQARRSQFGVGSITDDADQDIRNLFRSGCAEGGLFVDLVFLHNRIAMIDDERATPHRAPTAY